MGKCGLPGRKETEDFNVEYLVKLFFGEGLDW
jgi:hypothetical protein